MSRPAEPSHTGLEKVREHREELMDLAKSDLPVAWIAGNLLDAADEGETRLEDSRREQGGR